MTHMELRNVTLTTGSVIRVDDLSADVEAGHLIAIIGANGSGKSSLLSLMAGQLAPTSGEVLVDGQSVSSLPPAVRARHLAWLGQVTTGADSYAVRDVVAWGRVARSKGEVATAVNPADVIELVGLSQLANAPMGSLSGGERQRVHIARVWVQAAPITLLDEPDASLDQAGRLLLRQLITDKRNAGHTIVTVTHDRGWAASAADHVWVMDAGTMTTQ